MNDYILSKTGNEIDSFLNCFIPAGTTYFIEADGSGDFATLQEALDFMVGKFSNGIVTIQIGEGTFEWERTYINSSAFNFAILNIVGSGMDKTHIFVENISDYEAAIMTYAFGTPIILASFNLSAKTRMPLSRGITMQQGKLYDVDISNFGNCCINADANFVALHGTIKLSKTTWGVCIHACPLTCNWGTTVIISEVNYAFGVFGGCLTGAIHKQYSANIQNQSGSVNLQYI